LHGLRLEDLRGARLAAPAKRGTAAAQGDRMTGQVHWLPLAVVLLAAFSVAALWLREWREERKLRVEARFVRCRSRGNRLAQCVLVRDRKSGVPMGIRACSALPDPQDVRCGKTCLPLFAASP
jgi:hypothetical protein